MLSPPLVGGAATARLSHGPGGHTACKSKPEPHPEVVTTSHPVLSSGCCVDSQMVPAPQSSPSVPGEDGARPAFPVLAWAQQTHQLYPPRGPTLEFPALP